MKVENLITELEETPSDTLVQARVKNVREKFQATLKSANADFNGWDQWSEWHDFGNWNDSSILHQVATPKFAASMQTNDLFSDWTEWTEWGDAF